MLTLADYVKQHQEGIADEGVDYDDTTFAMCVQLYGLIQAVMQKQAAQEQALHLIIELLKKSRYVWSDATDVSVRPRPRRKISK